MGHAAQQREGSLPIILAIAMLITVVSGAFMLTCVQDAHASAPPTPYSGGDTCVLHEGHSAPDTFTSTPPDRSDASDAAMAFGTSPSRPVLSATLIESAHLAAPHVAGDPLCGRLLL
jgi:hypothetical protein